MREGNNSEGLVLGYNLLEKTICQIRRASWWRLATSVKQRLLLFKAAAGGYVEWNGLKRHAFSRLECVRYKDTHKPMEY